MPIGDLLPEIVVLLGAVGCLLMALALPLRAQTAGALLAIACCLAAVMLAWRAPAGAHASFAGHLMIDEATRIGRLTVLTITAAAAALAPSWFEGDRRHGEYYALLLLATLAAMLLAATTDIAMLLVTVLFGSACAYVLAAYHRAWAPSVEAGMRLFLIGAVSNTLMALGTVLVLGMAGHTSFTALAAMPAIAPLTGIGIALIMLGLLFELGAPPAHAWVPDVTQHAPLPSVAFLTIAPKVAAAIALARLLGAMPDAGAAAAPAMLALSVIAMTGGNLLALVQRDARRLIGWSSIAQAGYALIAMTAIGRDATAMAALLSFLIAYAVSNLAVLAVIAHWRGRTTAVELAGMGRQMPISAAVLIAALFSLVGIPPLAGFVGKFGLFRLALDNGQVWLAIAGIANSALSLAAYARLFVPIVFGTARSEALTLGRAPAMVVAITGAGLLVVAALAASLLAR
ncbi:MAG: proton-conducting transporter membrane subunit [Burkholderiaceae bacterium]